MKRLFSLCSFALLFALAAITARAEEVVAPLPMRPLPAASTRPLANGPQRFVDSVKGDDANDGTAAKPWRTLAFAATRLTPGDTLLLRGGLYREHATVSCAGTLEKPITIRAHPGELVILDGGLAEFYDSPETAWEPFAGGAEGEYRSTRTYPQKGGATADNDAETTLLGNFADSMVPLQGCHAMGDLRSSNPFWFGNGEKMDAGKTIYCGPSICFDDATQRIHARFAHTDLFGLGADNYRGETDPRKVRLVIATLEAGPVLKLRGARCLRLQDLVVRGARDVDRRWWKTAAASRSRGSPRTAARRRSACMGRAACAWRAARCAASRRRGRFAAA